MKVSAIITSGGSGVRLTNNNIPKQYLKIGGIPILARTISVFDNMDIINNIILVINKGYEDYCQKEILDAYRLKKVKQIAIGGASRQHSVYNGLMKIDCDTDIVVIHDGVRPFVTEDVILKSIKEAAEHGGSVVAVPTKDTIKIITKSGFVESTPDRNTLFNIQTPQTFRYTDIYNAHKKAYYDNMQFTDDSTVYEYSGGNVKVVTGRYDNIKITTSEDLELSEWLLQK